MSRGWESKNVESQQELQAAAKADATATPPVEKSDRARNIQADAEQRRKLQALHLQRESILSQRTSSPHRRTALETALADIEEKLAELGWTVHLWTVSYVALQARDFSHATSPLRSTRLYAMSDQSFGQLFLLLR